MSKPETIVNEALKKLEISLSPAKKQKLIKFAKLYSELFELSSEYNISSSEKAESKMNEKDQEVAELQKSLPDALDVDNIDNLITEITSMVAVNASIGKPKYNRSR